MDRSEYRKEYYEKNKDKAKAQMREYHDTHKEEINERKRLMFQRDVILREERSARSRKYYLENKESRKRYVVKKKYDISLDDVSKMMDVQKGCCAICGDSLVYPDSIKSYAIDHSHTTGEVRGLLCCNCNLALGQAKEDISLLKNMIAYLESNILLR